ncbi:MAG: hypothetical protein DRJ43_00840 [Thermoprotei archaeon]|nr:MAG: hypothetical protein DRJ43_00840 [Thermoprotei archaeon]
MSRAVLLTLFFLAGILLMVFLSTIREEKLAFEVVLEVSDSVSLSTTPDLDFGRLRPGDSGTKYISFRNNFILPVKLSVTASGNVSRWLRFEKESVVPPFSEVKIAIRVVVPANATKGVYRGRIVVRARRCLFGW